MSNLFKSSPMFDSIEAIPATKEVPPYRIPRKYVDGCKFCEEIKANDGFGPYHDAGNGCESGKRDHCTCDSCF